jgi:hypothetical protein
MKNNYLVFPMRVEYIEMEETNDKYNIFVNYSKQLVKPKLFNLFN